MKKKCVLNNAIQEGIFFLLLSGWLLWYSLDAYGKSYIKDWAQSPSLFPVLISSLLALFGFIILRQGLLQRNTTAEKKHAQPLQVLIILGMALGYYLALSVIKLPYMAMTISGLTFCISTFEVVTVIYLILMMLYLGVRSKTVLVLVPICSSAALSIIFRTMLRVLLP